MTDARDLWAFLPVGYLLTILIEAPILFVGLSRRHGPGERLFAGAWLTACTYPIVVLVLPVVLAGASRAVYLAVAETFAPLAECALFLAAFGRREPFSWRDRTIARDMAAIVAANLASFAVGEWLGRAGWFR